VNVNYAFRRECTRFVVPKYSDLVTSFGVLFYLFSMKSIRPLITYSAHWKTSNSGEFLSILYLLRFILRILKTSFISQKFLTC